MKKLNDSIKFRRGLKLKNRLVMAPMTNKMSFYDGVISSDELHYYSLRAGELGAIVTAAANVQDNGKGWEGELSVSNDKLLKGLSKLASNRKNNGTKAILQIFHAGRMSDSKILRGVQPVAPSPIKALRPNSETPRELTHEEIIELIENFKNATIRAIKAGFDGVEIHGANTYLIQQFFSPHSNRREDIWGGSLEKRYTFIDKLVDTIIETVDESDVENFIVGYRFSPEEYETPGIRLDDTLYLVDKLSDKKLDYLHISLGKFDLKSHFEDKYQEKSILAYVYEKINGRLPLISVGEVHTKNDAEEALKYSDIVAIGRALLIDPHWAGKILNNREELIKRFIIEEDRDEIALSNGAMDFLYDRMKDKIK